MSLPVVRHDDAALIGMISKRHAEHIENFALMPIRIRVDAFYCRDLGGFVAQLGTKADEFFIRQTV